MGDIKGVIARGAGNLALKGAKKSGEGALKGAKGLIVHAPKVGTGIAAAGAATYGLVEAEKYEKLLPKGTRNLTSTAIAGAATLGTGVAAKGLGFKGKRGWIAAALAGGSVAGARNVTDRIPGVEGFPLVPDSMLPSRRT